MPNNINFSKIENPVSEMIEYSIEDLFGWQNPLTIEYLYVNVNGGIQLYWRVKGTTHTFTVTLAELNSYSNGDYDQHFREVLEYFRNDLLEWSINPDETWKREYLFQFAKLVKL